MPTLTKEQIEYFMQMSIDIMKGSVQESRDDGKVSPYVGAVLVKPDGSYVTAHRGELRDGDHAEYTLIERKCVGEKLDGGILFATLEPCAPGSRKFPKKGCSQHIANARLSKVYIGIEDPDPTVDRKGIKYLQEKGIEIEMYPQDLQKEIREFNAEFLKGAIERASIEHDDEILLTPKEKGELTANIADLSEKLLIEFIDKSKINCQIGTPDFYRIMSQYGIITENKGTYIPTGLGLLLFGNNPQATYPNAMVRATCKKNGKESIFNADGPLILQPEQLWNWYSNLIGNHIDRGEATRKTIYDYPLEVINELVKNAILHRDYDIEGAPIYLEITDDNIIIKSPGAPVSPLKLEQFISFSAPSLSRNPKLMYIFDIFGLAEQRGLGFSTVRELPKRNFPLPIVQYEDPYLIFTLPRNDKSAAVGKLEGIKVEERKGYEFILQSSQPVSRADYETVMQIESRTAQRQLKTLIDHGLIKPTGIGRSMKYEAIKE
jgi:ATP-dependent DNA helicase RecG